jgi:hypothetical protein
MACAKYERVYTADRFKPSPPISSSVQPGASEEYLELGDLLDMTIVGMRRER